MPETFLIDGNNLLHAVRVLGPTRPPGREKLTRLIERWTNENRAEVTIFFDGPAPAGAFGTQMQSRTVELIFSGSRTADDCIVERLQSIRNADRVKVVSDDSAICYAARQARCSCVSTATFMAALFPPHQPLSPEVRQGENSDKPMEVSENDRQAWLALFDDGSDDPFDGYEAMKF